jgi:hypothetical protein
LFGEALHRSLGARSALETFERNADHRELGLEGSELRWIGPLETHHVERELQRDLLASGSELEPSGVSVHEAPPSSRPIIGASTVSHRQRRRQVVTWRA